MAQEKLKTPASVQGKNRQKIIKAVYETADGNFR